jgi:hypothetical protein
VILLGGPNSTNPVAMDPVIVKAIDHLSPPVASLMNKAAGARCDGARGPCMCFGSV